MGGLFGDDYWANWVLPHSLDVSAESSTSIALHVRDNSRPSILLLFALNILKHRSFVFFLSYITSLFNINFQTLTL
jgi:hypothetical protein